MTKIGSRTVSLILYQQKLCPRVTFLTFSPSRALLAAMARPELGEIGLSSLYVRVRRGGPERPARRECPRDRAHRARHARELNLGHCKGVDLVIPATWTGATAITAARFALGSPRCEPRGTGSPFSVHRLYRSWVKNQMLKRLKVR